VKTLNHLLVPCLFIIFTGCGTQSEKQPGRKSDYDRGYYHLYYNKKDSAYLMFTRYVNNPDDSLKKGKAYRYMGEMLWETGDLHGAEENLTGAIRTLNPLDSQQRAEIGYTYNLLGNVSLDLKLYDEAISLYNKGMRFSEGSDYIFEEMNGKATALQKKRNYTEAIAIYDSILAQKPADLVLVARITDNRARTKWLQDPSYPVLTDFHYALKIRTDSQVNAGLNASYAHLADYYAGTKPDSALWYANKMLVRATANESPDDILEAIDKLIRLNNNPAVKEQWYKAFKKLNDSVQLSRDTTRNRFALIRYDVQKSKADNLVLQKNLTTQRLLIYGVIALAVIIITGLWLWYRKYRKRIKQESENTIRNSRLKTSQKIHDVVANGLYGIMNELEHSNNIEREPLIDKIEGLYEKSRNISYEDVVAADPADYDIQIPRLLSSFANEQTKVITVGDQQKFWSNITGSQKHELYLVLNEIMINMRKHSQAKNVVIQFKQEHHKGFINYKDDGIGFNPGQKSGNGLKNTVSRIKSMGGEVNFGNAESGGIAIAISFPLQPDQT
jgi:tetratricopeptide (TPR) repeat protein